MKLTQERLEAIRQRAENATPGPWILSPEKCGPEGQGVYEAESFGHICEVGDPYPRGNNRPQENMEFIAHARTDIPALLDHIAELEAELEKYRKILHGELRIVVKKNDVPILDLDGVNLSVEKPVKEDDQ